MEELLGDNVKMTDLVLDKLNLVPRNHNINFIRWAGICIHLCLSKSTWPRDLVFITMAADKIIGVHVYTEKRR